MSGRVLIVDDERSMCEVLEAGLTPKGFVIKWTTSAPEALDLLHGTDVDVVLTDLNMRGMNGLELCERIVTNRPDVPVVVITAFGSFETAVAAIRAGAYDFTTKPVKFDALALALERAVQHRTLRAEVKRLFDIPPRAFTPPPKVTSTVVELIPRATPAYPAIGADLEQVTAAAFGQRRKMLRQSLKKLPVNVEALIRAAEVMETARAEELTVAQFCAVARAFADLRGRPRED